MKNYLLLVLSLLCLLIQAMSAAQATAQAPREAAGAHTIGTATAKLLFDKEFLFIDVRSAKDFKSGHIPGARHLAVHSEDFNAKNLSAIAKKDQAVVFYCNGIACMGSSIASQKAVEWGWTQIIYYREGFQQWRNDGLPVE